ncbi:putative reverse transcriptase domain-containing protein [Tanacetum coccineum]
MAPSRQSSPSNNEENPDIAAIIAHQLQTILHQIVTQVTNNVNNANGGNGGNNGCTYKGFMAYNPKEVKYAASSFVNKALTWWNTQVQARGREAAIVTPESSRIKRYIAGLAPEIQGMLRATQPTIIHSAILRAGILTDEAVSYGTLTKGNEKRKGVEESSKHGSRRNDDKRVKVVPINAVRGGYEPGTCNECGSHEHYQNTCPKLNLDLFGPLQDPNVVTGTFSLNHHYTTVLFDSRADFSFISTSFAPLLNVKSSFVNPRYLIEVANGKKVEVDRVIRNCKLELGTSLFTIDLILLGHGSFDVIVGMDWLSEHKAEIVCHEKVVRIPLESVYSKSKKEHEVHLRLVLELLKKEELYTKFSKCEFWLQEVQFLSHVVNQNGIHVGLSKIEAVKNWKAPTTPSEIRLFLGLAEITKSIKYEWDVEQEEAFQNLKDNLCNAPILSLPNGVEDFMVYCDASNQGLGHVLMQKGKELNMRQRRWIELFSDYECEIRYHPGKANVVADALSRKEPVKPRRV